ncbi:MBL fold metallo-hydrolase [Micromonospora inositola]|uniref:Glyoxylase, beta-lactamase superfamily II n=1 Tax=Micromonospora inositola TaxID=47865 RepID=A0A1C5JMX0_9ACTN|nr:Glyoxylase, beta-lactamase superfamily II [Micromonospora inositola]
MAVDLASGPRWGRPSACCARLRHETAQAPAQTRRARSRRRPPPTSQRPRCSSSITSARRGVDGPTRDDAHRHTRRVRAGRRERRVDDGTRTRQFLRRPGRTRILLRYRKRDHSAAARWPFPPSPVRRCDMTQGPARVTSTVRTESPDSGQSWIAEGAWPVASGVHRIPLPLPNDGLRAVNVYAIETGGGLVLVDGGWALPNVPELLDRSLRTIGSGLGDVTTFLVTHAHRDHYTLARVLGDRLGAQVVLGAGERPALDVLRRPDWTYDPLVDLLRHAGAHELAERVLAVPFDPPNPVFWAAPDRWLDSETSLELGERRVDAIPTPGHTPGHFVFVETAQRLLFAGDHVLPTITPSIGFAAPRPVGALADYLRSLTKILQLPDLHVLPAHGPTGTWSHARARQLLEHHDVRLEATLDTIRDCWRGVVDVASRMAWTRRELALDQLDVFNQAVAVLETEVHLELLAADGRAHGADGGRGREYRATRAG